MYAEKYKYKLPKYNNIIRLFDEDGNKLYKINWVSTDKELISSHIQGLKIYGAFKIQYNEGEIYSLAQLNEILEKKGDITIKELKQMEV